MHLGYLIAAVAVSVAGAVTDVRTARIPNRLTYTAMLLALAVHTMTDGWRGTLQSLGGLVLCGGIFFVLFALHAMGGGDVKMMAAVGALVGLAHSAEALIASCLCGGVMALIYMFVKKRTKKTLQNLGSLVQHHAIQGAEVHPELNLSNPDAVKMPYGVAIASGAIVVFCMTLWKG
ncbi:MAG: prepilin peptidase [Acidobacteriota bacterium]|nr:prepilin peptidase [Acidobacteriota bacterium]